MGTVHDYEPVLFSLGKVTPEWLIADTLSVDHRYQRDLDPSQVNEIIAEFDPDLLGGLIVSQRYDGTAVVLDGQTRLASIMKMGYGDQRVPCFVLRGLTPQQEAKIFVGTNKKRRGVNPFHLFRGDVFRGEPQALAIKRVLDELDLRVAHGQVTNPRSVRAIGTIRVIHTHLGSVGLHRVLRILRDAFKSPDGFDRDLLHGLAMVIATFPDVSDDRLIRYLSSCDPHSLLRGAHAMKGNKGDSIASYAAFAIADAYNKKARGTRLTTRGPSDFMMALRGMRNGNSVFANRQPKP